MVIIAKRLKSHFREILHHDSTLSVVHTVPLHSYRRNMKSESHSTVTGGRPGSWNSPLDLWIYLTNGVTL